MKYYLKRAITILAVLAFVAGVFIGASVARKEYLAAKKAISEKIK